MREYHKIQSVYLRDPANNHRTFLEGQFARKEFEYLRNNVWEFTEKVDGTNIRVRWDGESIRFGGRTDRAQIPATLVNVLSEMFPAELFSEFFQETPLTLYGEGYGPKIQKGGGNYRSDQSFVLFDVRIGDYWLQREDVEDIADQLKIGVVPLLGRGSLLDAVDWCRKGFLSRWGNFQAEGLVCRPWCELVARNGDRIITKIKCRDFTQS